MLNTNFVDELKNIQQEDIIFDEPMKNHTSFKIGGNADIYIEPSGVDQFSAMIKLCNRYEVPFIVIGAGSNLLVSDKGIRGVVIKMGKAFDFVNVDDDIVEVGAGTTLAKLANVAAEHSLSGLEFASGIPGSVGGAVYMNAGAYGGEMVDVVIETTYLDKNGDVHVVTGKDHEFSYRHSIFSNDDKFIAKTKCKLYPGNREDIIMKMRELNLKRKQKQPLEYPSGGSTFKRPDGYFAAQLIEDAGLKGCKVGGAQVSEKHSGFIINIDCASQKDVCDLMEHVQEKVRGKFGVELTPEVKRIGE